MHPFINQLWYESRHTSRMYKMTSPHIMNWHDLLSTKRWGAAQSGTSGREESPFLLDLDRITFSSYFRRLQDKTQVHPLSEGGRVRSRLTHSIEVASVGRSLGFGVGQRLLDRQADLPETITPHDFGYIVQAACLSHDIGNPAFGHAGEEAIVQWFIENRDWAFDETMSEDEAADFVKFEGNAQGFRILNRLDYFRKSGGFCLSYATLGAFTKYPGDASTKGVKRIESKKAGFCQSEKEIFLEVADELGLIRQGEEMLWCRHPLAFLMEAADDICYRVADLEDGVTMDCVTFEDVERHLAPLARSPLKYQGNDEQRWYELTCEDWYQKMSRGEKLGFLRGKAIGNLTGAVVDAFMEHEKALLEGRCPDELLALTPFAEAAQSCKQFAGRSIFATRRKLEIETASFRVLGCLLDVFVHAILDYEKKGADLSKTMSKHQRALRLMDVTLPQKQNRYNNLLFVMDFISGLSDRAAVNLYKSLTGISL